MVADICPQERVASVYVFMEGTVLTQKRNLTVDEIIERIEGLSGHEYLKIADTRLPWSLGLPGWSPDDLFQETLTRLINDERHLRNDIDFTYGLLTIMRSLADERRKQQAKYWLDLDDNELDGQSDEDILEDLIQEEILAEIQKRVGNDNTASDVLQLRAQEFKPDEICEKLSIRKMTYDSALKRISRAVRKYKEENADG